LWSTKSDTVAAELDEVVTGAVLATLGVSPQEAIAKATADEATAITTARERAGAAYPGHDVGWATLSGLLVLMASPVSCRYAGGVQGTARSAKNATSVGSDPAIRAERHVGNDTVAVRTQQRCTRAGGVLFRG
jgi:hypothetical protein